MRGPRSKELSIAQNGGNENGTINHIPLDPISFRAKHLKAALTKKGEEDFALLTLMGGVKKSQKTD
jgi:hypothetical protein